MSAQTQLAKPPSERRSFATAGDDWHRTLFWAAAACVGLFAANGIRQFDREALGFAVLYLAGLGLTGLGRRGRIGIILLGLLSIDTLFWMATATVSNIQNREAVISILQPLALASASAITLVAAAGSLFQRDRVAVAGRLVAGVTIAVFALTFVGEAVLATNEHQGSGQLGLEIHNTAYSTRTLTASSGHVSLSATNRDLFWHTFTIDKLGVNVAMPVGSHRQITFDAAPGTYTFYCAIPGHRQAGMQGTITVP